MDKQFPKVALLFFSRSPGTEANCKHLTYPFKKRSNTRVAEALIRHTQQQIIESGLPCFIFDEKRQRGSTFAERFTNAFEVVFAKGFEHIIAIGNDTPGLKTDHLIHATRRLTSGKADIVLGPATDGGTWLTGYSRHAFDADAFCGLPWNSPDLLDETLRRSPQNCTITLLEEFADIDDHASLQQFVNTLYGDWSLAGLARLIQSVLSGNGFPSVEIVHSHFLNLFFKSHLLRAPPL